MEQPTPGIAIEIDDEVWAALKADAEPFVDTPNDVLRRKLGLDEGEAPALQGNGGRVTITRRRPRRGAAKKKQRAPRGSLLPGEAYELPILKVLADNGGRAPASEVIVEVGNLIGDQLMPLDREHLETGDLRWHKRVQFTRLRLVERGLVRKDSPRGVWEITDDGRRALTAGTTTV